MKNELELRPDQFFLIAGPCVAENETVCFQVAEVLRTLADTLNIQVVFKASYIKANRSSGKSYRGPGMEEGLALLRCVREKYKLPILTDVHETSEVEPVAAVVDILQIPAFLCRQTALLEAAGRTGKWVNVKKGQFLAPWDMTHVVDKIREQGNENVLVTERGSSFGYNNLVVDYRSLIWMRRKGWPVIFDATHSVQLPSAQGSVSGGDRTLAAPLAQAAAALGVQGFFFETHPDPDKALSDGPNSVFLKDLPAIVQNLLALHHLFRELPACPGSF